MHRRVPEGGRLGLGVFVAMAAGMALVVAALMTLALLRGGTAPDGGEDRKVYADQLREIERDTARGTLGPDEAMRLRAEVARRLLAADRAGAGAPDRTGPLGLGVMLAGLVVVVGAAVGYWHLGAPGYPDLPLRERIVASEAARAARPDQASAEASQAVSPAPAPDVAPDYLSLMETLRAKVAERPDDLQGHILLAENEAQLGNAVAARAAQERVVALKGDAVTSADQTALARYRIAAAGGIVTAEAEAALAAALALDSLNGEALFFAGIAELQVGRPDRALPHWRRVVEVAPPDSPWLAQVRNDIAAVAAAAGVKYELPEATAQPGPDADAVAAAAAMTPEERMTMIRGMVDGLSDRLASEGGPAEDWARLIGSLGVLGETERARAIWGEAQKVFAGREGDLAMIHTAAMSAGVAE